jgi:uncharacterized peroxidase-related enzyme
MTEEVADQFVHQISTDWRKAPLNPPDHALCAFAEKLTLDQHSMSETDVESLRNLHFSDAAIHDAAQVIGYFNYITRIADALGVEQESFIREWEKTE